MSRRYATQRSNRVRLKADCAVLLERIQIDGAEPYLDEIVEMRVRLHPKPGVAAPIVLTGYTGSKAEKLTRAVKPAHWAAEIRLRPVDGGDERWGLSLDSIRYRKD